MSKSQYEQIAKEILLMVCEDQKMLARGKTNGKMFRLHADRMKEIIKKFGWPGKSLVGKKAADLAWLLVQHADYDVKLQIATLKILRKEACRGEVGKFQVAYLTDRVLVNTGRPQLFGTQFYPGIMKPRPIKNPQYLNRRRKAYGLGPFKEYAAQLKVMRESRKKRSQDKNG